MTDKQDLKDLIIEGIQDRKGKKITIVDMEHIESAAAGMFIIAEGSSTTNVTSIADSVREYVQKNGDVKPYNYDGYRSAEWIVIDYGNILVHIFLTEKRSLYNLEELWSYAKITDIPDLD